MRKAYQILLLCLAMFASPLLWAQQHHLTDSLQSRFKRYQSGVLQEKLFVHIDRTSYLAGELLWFKIYYVDATHYKALDISRVAYVEILDKNNDAVVQSKVELRNGVVMALCLSPQLWETEHMFSCIHPLDEKFFSGSLFSSAYNHHQYIC